MLPVSGVALAVREPSGEDELFVVETTLGPLPALLEIARRVVTTVGGAPVDWATLPATDVSAVALFLRRTWVGSVVRTDTGCPGPGCGERIDVSFSVADYLEHHRPRRPRGALPTAGEGGWYELVGTPVRFRVPTVADLLAATTGSIGVAALTARCIESPAPVTRALARRIDTALAAIAPSLDDLVGGMCPACGAEVAMRFDPVSYTLAELRDAFSGVHAETHALASAYGWAEATILALPRGRRRRYAAYIAEERSVA